MPIVKIEFIEHNRTYTIGIKRFLKELGLNVTDEEIKTATNKILNEV